MTWFGDLHLAGATTALAGQDSSPLAVAVVAGGRSRIAVRNAHPAADFELGSISKGITALLYRDAVDRRVLTPHTQLGEILPLPACPAAQVTLESLSTHTSGLPRLPPHTSQRRTTLSMLIRCTNPYGGTLNQVLGELPEVPRGKPEPAYSNLGFTLLGHAVASARDLSYPSLMQQRLCEPLGLNLYAPYEPSNLHPGALRGRDELNRRQHPWTGEDLAPAGGVRGSITELAILAAALLQQTAPGISALDPVRETDSADTRIGAAWYTTLDDDAEVTWHNGATAGFSSWMGLDRAAARAVVVLQAKAGSVDPLGWELLRSQA